MTPDKTVPQADSQMSTPATTEEALQELDQMLRNTFGQSSRPAVTPVPRILNAAPQAMTFANHSDPVMLPAAGPLRQTKAVRPTIPSVQGTAAPIAAAPDSATQLPPKPELAAARIITAAATTDSAPAAIAPLPPPAARRPLRPLPEARPPETLERIAPISARRSVPWRPAAALTAAAMVLGVAGNFAWTSLRQPPAAVQSGPPMIVAPAEPSGAPADPSIVGPPPVLAAPEPSRVEPQPVVADTGTKPVDQPKAEAVTNQAEAVMPKAEPPVIETAGVLGDPAPAPFDSAVPMRSVRTTVIASNDIPVTPPAVQTAQRKQISMADPATWPIGASIADPHPLPPRRR